MINKKTLVSIITLAIVVLSLVSKLVRATHPVLSMILKILSFALMVAVVGWGIFYSICYDVPRDEMPDITPGHRLIDRTNGPSQKKKNIILYCSGALLIVGSILKLCHVPGATIIVTVGFLGGMVATFLSFTNHPKSE